jgi:pyruvate/2-oxoglutarate dehydrogenase complex dihydrolipoamide acyltransferase (E2) component
VSASGFRDDKVIFGGNFILEPGESLNGDLVVFGGNITLRESSTVNGDAVVLGGNVTAAGTVNGNLVALGGLVELGGSARINGDLTALGSSFEQDEGAYISGNVVTEEGIPFELSLPDNLGFFNGGGKILRSHQLPFVSASWFFFRLLIWSGLAVLIALFIQDQAAVINRTAFSEPFLAILVGLGVLLIAPLVILALLITILLSPVSLVGIFALIAAWVVGLVAVSIEVGRKLSSALNQNWPVPVLAGVGMFVLSLFFNGFNQIVPCVGWMPKFLLGTWVLGAVVLTRFGTSAYPDEPDQPSASTEVETLPPPFDGEAEPKLAESEIEATNAARDLAKAEGLDLRTITGTGAEGRITINDVRKALKK